MPMNWDGKIGNDLVAEGQPTPKPPGGYEIVGQSPPRFDVPAKVFGTLDSVTDTKVSGMLQGRMVRSPVAGAVPVAVDEGSVRDIPGGRVVRDKGFLGIRRAITRSTAVRARAPPSLFFPHDQFMAVRDVRNHQKPRSSQAPPKALYKSAQFALGISGRCRELRERNDPPVPLVQRREQSPFRRRQLTSLPILEEKREVLPIYARIGIHQVRGGDLCATAPAEAPPGQTCHEYLWSSIRYIKESMISFLGVVTYKTMKRRG
jgi:hypothetical protein